MTSSNENFFVTHLSTLPKTLINRKNHYMLYLVLVQSIVTCFLLLSSCSLIESTITCFYYLVLAVGSRRAHNLVCMPYLDFGENLFCQNRSINPCKPIRIHLFLLKQDILKDSRRDRQCARPSKPMFCITEVLMYI